MRMASKKVIAIRTEICSLMHAGWEVSGRLLPSRPTECKQLISCCYRQMRSSYSQDRWLVCHQLTCGNAEGIRVDAERGCRGRGRCRQGTCIGRRSNLSYQSIRLDYSAGCSNSQRHRGCTDPIPIRCKDYSYPHPPTPHAEVEKHDASGCKPFGCRQIAPRAFHAVQLYGSLSNMSQTGLQDLHTLQRMIRNCIIAIVKSFACMHTSL